MKQFQNPNAAIWQFLPTQTHNNPNILCNFKYKNFFRRKNTNDGYYICVLWNGFYCLVSHSTGFKSWMNQGKEFLQNLDSFSSPTFTSSTKIQCNMQFIDICWFHVIHLNHHHHKMTYTIYLDLTNNLRITLELD